MFFYLITRFLAHLWDVPVMTPEGRIVCSIVSFIEIIFVIILIISAIFSAIERKETKRTKNEI